MKKILFLLSFLLLTSFSCEVSYAQKRHTDGTTVYRSIYIYDTTRVHWLRIMVPDSLSADSATIDLTDLTAWSTHHLIVTCMNFTAADSIVGLIPLIQDSITITRIDVSLDGVSEVSGDIMYADSLTVRTNRVLINDFDTVGGKRTDTSITCAGVPVGKSVFIKFNSAPTNNVTIDITYH